MATMGIDSGGRKRILFFDREGQRRTLRLGKLSERDAKTIKVHVELIVHAQITCESPPVDTSRWLADLDDALHARFRRFGLTNPRDEVQTASLNQFVTDYIARPLAGTTAGKCQ